MGPEGMEKFCEDIGVEPENVRSFSLMFLYFLAVAFHLSAQLSCSS